MIGFVIRLASAVLIYPIFGVCFLLQQKAIVYYSVHMPENPAIAAYSNIALQLLPWMIAGICAAVLFSQPTTISTVCMLFICCVISLSIYSALFFPDMIRSMIFRPSIELVGLYVFLAALSFCQWCVQWRQNK